MGKRLYVGNIPYQTSEAQLRTLFEQDGGQVEEVKIVTDRETGRPRDSENDSRLPGPSRLTSRHAVIRAGRTVGVLTSFAVWC